MNRETGFARLYRHSVPRNEQLTPEQLRGFLEGETLPTHEIFHGIVRVLGLGVEHAAQLGALLIAAERKETYSSAAWRGPFWDWYEAVKNLKGDNRVEMTDDKDDERIQERQRSRTSTFNESKHLHNSLLKAFEEQREREQREREQNATAMERELQHNSERFFRSLGDDFYPKTAFSYAEREKEKRNATHERDRERDL